MDPVRPPETETKPPTPTISDVSAPSPLPVPGTSVSPDGPPAAQPAPPSRAGRPWLKRGLLIVGGLVVLGGVALVVRAIWQPIGTSTTNQQKDVTSLTVGVIDGSISYYPHNTSDSYARTLSDQIFEGLVHYTDQTKVEPLLASGWTNPNSSTWDFDLRHNVSFHNGHTMTAADVVYSMNLAKKDKDLGSTQANTLQSAKALDDYRVEIKTSAPDPFFLNKLSQIMILDAKVPKADDTSNGTGPYELKPGTKPTDTEIQLVAYDGYHGGHVYTRALTFVSEKSRATASADFKAGKINMVGEYDSTAPAELKNTPYQRFSVDTADVTFMTLNSIAPGPLQKLPVRQALRDSLDKSLLIKNAGLTATPANQLMPPSIPGYNPSVSSSKRDITKAKQLLSSAGISGRVALTMETSNANQAIAQEIANQAQAAGFDITIKQQPDFDQLIQDMVNGTYPLTLLSYSSDVLDGADVFTQVLQQTNNYKSATLDAYLDQANKTIDPAKRLQIVQTASQYVDDQVAALPLFSRIRTWATDKPYTMQFDSLLSDPGVYFWKVSLRG